MTSEQVITEARAYADRIAVRMADEAHQREEFSKAAFLAYMKGFQDGITFDKPEQKHD